MASSKLKLVLDSKDLKKRLKKVESAVGRDAVEKGLRAGSKFLMGHMAVNMDKVLDRQTGNLIGSIQEEELVVSTRRSFVTFGPHTVYAAIHEFGGVIRPTNGKYLAFMGRDGKMVFTKSVTMPARPYMRPALDDHGADALKLMGDTIGKVIDGAYG